MKFDLATGVSIAVLLIASAPIYAQTANETTIATEKTDGDPNKTEEDVKFEEIVVTGFRQANSAAIASKRNSDMISDGINQDTVGLLPDFTVADIASRISGVTAVSSTGITGPRSRADSEAIVIRGLSPDFNLTTFDGVPIASASESSRGANLSLFPPAVVSRVEAIKTISADMNPHGLSGQLNLRTASAFSRDGLFGNARVSVGENSTAGDVISDQGKNIRATGLIGTTFGEGDQFGVVLSGSYEQFFSTSRDERPGGQSDTYLFYPEDLSDNTLIDIYEDSNGFAAPRRNQLYLFENEKKRMSVAGKLEWQPDHATYASLFAAWFSEDEYEVRHENLAVAQLSQRPLNQTAMSGDWPEARLETGYVSQPRKTDTKVITGHIEHDVNSDHGLELTASFSRADVDITRNMSKFTGSYSAESSFSYDLSSGSPVLSFVNPDFVNDVSSIPNSYIRTRTQDMRQDVVFINGSWDWNYDDEDEGFGLKVGATYLSREQSFDREYIEGDVFNTVGCTEADITDCPLVTLDQYIEDSVFLTSDPNVNFYLIDDAALRAEWIAQGQTLTTDRTDNSVNSDYTIDEKNYAFYVQGVYQTDRLEIHAGLRYDSTKDDVDLFIRDTQLPSDPDSAQYVPAQREYDYDYFLPSLIVSYEATDQLLLRAAYTRTMGRPNFSYLKRAETYSVPDDNDPTDLRITVSRGNPDLKPLIADNFDVSAEYYFDQGSSMVSLAGFYKSIDDLIYVSQQEISGFEYEGQIYTATITQPINLSDSSLYGVEFNIRKDFADTLPAPFDGFVFNGNITWIGSEFTYISTGGEERDPGGWVNQPDLLANAQLSYEKGNFKTKVSYRWVDEYFANILSDDGNIHDVFAKARGVIDMQVRYRVRDGLTVIGEVRNLTEEGLEYVRRFPTEDLLSGNAQSGRVIWLGLNYDF